MKRAEVIMLGQDVVMPVRCAGWQGDELLSGKKTEEDSRSRS